MQLLMELLSASSLQSVGTYAEAQNMLRLSERRLFTLRESLSLIAHDRFVDWNACQVL